ncbi:MAG: photoactive yellow protein [Thermoanaerobaculia bacterium]|nr:photoactive yellow protein [Thermoanaerobaculia bacterium]
MNARCSQRWFDLGSEALPRELGTFGPRDFDLLPFGTFTVDREGTVLDWEPGGSSRRISLSADELRGRSFFRQVAPCFFVADFQKIVHPLFGRNSFDETFFFTFRFPGEWRQARMRMRDDRNGRIEISVISTSRIGSEAA